MNKASQRIAIAKACGWKTHVGFWFNEELDKTRPKSDDGIRIEPPDYLNDLNAMHEAESVLFKDEFLWMKYRDELHKFYYTNDTFSPTASQRAEAFLRTLGKWTQE
jgi:hypothetical protein